jgi:hypothetical protein
MSDGNAGVMLVVQQNTCSSITQNAAAVVSTCRQKGLVRMRISITVDAIAFLFILDDLLGGIQYVDALQGMMCSWVGTIRILYYYM